MKTLLLTLSLLCFLPGFSQDHQTLPTVWKSFTAVRSGESVMLYWSTLTETPTVSYVLQHSKNAKDWQDIITLSSESGTVLGSQYQYTHTRPGSGDHYYRILLRDINLIDLSSAVRKVSMEGKDLPFEIVENPARGKRVQIDCVNAITIQLYTSSGNLLLTRSLQAGHNEINLSARAAGVYFVYHSGYAQRICLE